MKKFVLAILILLPSLVSFCQVDSFVEKIDSSCSAIERMPDLVLRFESGSKIDPATKKIIHFTNIYYLDTIKYQMKKANLIEKESRRQEIYYFQNNHLIKVSIGEIGVEASFYQIYFDNEHLLFQKPLRTDNSGNEEALFIEYTWKAKSFLQRIIPVISPND
jgi:hypothetical protein